MCLCGPDNLAGLLGVSRDSLLSRWWRREGSKAQAPGHPPAFRGPLVGSLLSGSASSQAWPGVLFMLCCKAWIHPPSPGTPLLLGIGAMPWPLSWDDIPNALVWLCKALHPGEEHTCVPRMVLMCPPCSLQEWSIDLPRCLEVPWQKTLSCQPSGGPSSAGKGLVSPPGLDSSSDGWRHLWTVILALDVLNELSQSMAFCCCTSPSSQSYSLPFAPSGVDLKILLNRHSAGQSPALRVLGNPSPITQFLDLQGFRVVTSAYLVLGIQSHLESHWPDSFQMFPEVRPSSAALHIWKKVSLLRFYV